jgi:hypothetical protein
MSRALVVILSLSFIGCGDDYGIDLDNTIRYPGPCSARNEYYSTEYDYVDERLVRAEVNGRSDDEAYTYSADWTWVDGSPSSVTQRSISNRETRWTFEPTLVVRSTDGVVAAVYDRERFAFDRLPGQDVLLPSADLGLLSSREPYVEVFYTWTMDGNRHVRSNDQRDPRRRK